MTRINATANNKGDDLEIVFDSYGPGNMYGSFTKGDVLFTLIPAPKGLAIRWKEMQPNNSNNLTSSMFFKKVSE